MGTPGRHSIPMAGVPGRLGCPSATRCHDPGWRGRRAGVAAVPRGAPWTGVGKLARAMSSISAAASVLGFAVLPSLVASVAAFWRFLYLDRDLGRAGSCGLERVGVLERLRQAVLRAGGLVGGGDAGGLDALGELAHG
jgi:hypothetical protein